MPASIKNDGNAYDRAAHKIATEEGVSEAEAYSLAAQRNPLFNTLEAIAGTEAVPEDAKDIKIRRLKERNFELRVELLTEKGMSYGDACSQVSKLIKSIY